MRRPACKARTSDLNSIETIRRYDTQAVTSPAQQRLPAHFYDSGAIRFTVQSAITSMGMGFTPRQAQILELAARGRADKQIAGALGGFVHAVRAHLRRLYETLALATRAEAAAAS